MKKIGSVHNLLAILTLKADTDRTRLLWKEILQDMHTKWFKLLICFQSFGKSEKIWKLNDFENSIFASRYQIMFGLCGP